MPSPPATRVETQAGPAASTTPPRGPGSSTPLRIACGRVTIALLRVYSAPRDPVDGEHAATRCTPRATRALARPSTRSPRRCAGSPVPARPHGLRRRPQLPAPARPPVPLVFPLPERLSYEVPRFPPDSVSLDVGSESRSAAHCCPMTTSSRARLAVCPPVHSPLPSKGCAAPTGSPSDMSQQ